MSLIPNQKTCLQCFSNRSFFYQKLLTRKEVCDEFSDKKKKDRVTSWSPSLRQRPYRRVPQSRRNTCIFRSAPWTVFKSGNIAPHRASFFGSSVFFHTTPFIPFFASQMHKNHTTIYSIPKPEVPQEFFRLIFLLPSGVLLGATHIRSEGRPKMLQWLFHKKKFTTNKEILNQQGGEPPFPPRQWQLSLKWYLVGSPRKLRCFWRKVRKAS